MLLASGASQDEILQGYPYRTGDDITSCLEYAAMQAHHAVLIGSSLMRFLVDAQLPPALARMLFDLGHPRPPARRSAGCGRPRSRRITKGYTYDEK